MAGAGTVTGGRGGGLGPAYPALSNPLSGLYGMFANGLGCAHLALHPSCTVPRFLLKEYFLF